MLSPLQIEQSNNVVRRAVAVVRIERNPATLNRLYSALQFRRRARSLLSRPQSAHWIAHGL